MPRFQFYSLGNPYKPAHLLEPSKVIFASWWVALSNSFDVISSSAEPDFWGPEFTYNQNVGHISARGVNATDSDGKEVKHQLRCLSLAGIGDPRITANQNKKKNIDINTCETKSLNSAPVFCHRISMSGWNYGIILNNYLGILSVTKRKYDGYKMQSSVISQSALGLQKKASWTISSLA